MTVRIAVWILIFFWGAAGLIAGQIDSLSQLYLVGKGVLDLDRDGYADHPNLSIILPDKPTASELAVAGDLSARINLESLAVDFSAVRRESSASGNDRSIPIWVGGRTAAVTEIKGNDQIAFGSLKENQGLIHLVTREGRTGVAVVAGSEEALRRTGRAFFLRWPYLWDVWGRRQGQTYTTVEEDLKAFLLQADIERPGIVTVSAFYDFPSLESPFDAVKRLEFHPGEIRELTLRVRLETPENWDSARDLLRKLADRHRRGLDTQTLSYAGCARIAFLLEHSGQTARIELDRMGYPKRMLTPGYRSPQKPSIPKRDFDLLDFLTTSGAYGDTDRDRIPDQIRTRIVLPQEAVPPQVTQLADRLVLNTAGSSFPLLALDSEIEEPKALDSPVLIGRENNLVKELIRTGKLKPLPAQENQAVVQVISQALNASNALVILGGNGRSGEGAALEYLSRTFPYLTHFEEGEPSLLDIAENLSDLLSGRHGSAEAFLYGKLTDTLERIEDKSLESFSLKLHLPQGNPTYVKFIEDRLDQRLTARKIDVKSFTLDDTESVFHKDQDFTWEGQEALDLLSSHLGRLEGASGPISVSLGLSESPEVRSDLAARIGAIIQESGLKAGNIDVCSAYKAGFYWLTERILPRLEGLEDLDHVIILFRLVEADFSKPRRFYADPYRWLQELYPVDEFLARLPSLSLERIDFEARKDSADVYEFLAYAADGNLLLRETFSPHTRRLEYLKALPEWGDVTVSTGWLSIRTGDKVVADLDIKTDLERFWEFYQDEVLSDVYDHILKKTANRPAFAKQPYFKRLLIDLELSEPDYRMGLDEEIVSSLEAIHDEIYFDTLDFLRGITEIELDGDEAIPEDSSRYSAPGNILPRIHPSLEGGKGRVQVTLEDWQVRTPRAVISWQEPGRHANQRTFVFPKFKPEPTRLPGFVYDGTKRRIDRLTAVVDLNAEKDYLALLDILESLQFLQERKLVPILEAPGLGSVWLTIKHDDLTRDILLPVIAPAEPETKSTPAGLPETRIVPTQEIISPDMCLRIVEKLSASPAIRTYIAGHSYEERRIPVLEVFTPRSAYVSIPRLVTAKPTLYLSGRQHANEVSSTNYILRFAELLARDPGYQEYIQRVNFVLHPLENPDGAVLAYELQKLTPFHSLHAGRYSALGIDIGYQTGSSRPLLPEAQVRGKLHRKWLPDIYLNLHGYPSHEWVQPFSGYAPYLFRDYWIPRGWFAYVRAASLPLYPAWVKAGEDVMNHIIRGMQDQRDIHASNRRFYDRYERWAARWHPHMNYLERYGGVNLYARRRSGRESRLSERRRLTYVEETPELMDETARGDWLDFLCRQGLTYVRAHTDYLANASFTRVRIEEESRDRIHITFSRKRPGSHEK